MQASCTMYNRQIKSAFVFVNEVMKLGAHHQFQLFIDDPLAALTQVVETLGGFAAGRFFSRL